MHTQNENMHEQNKELDVDIVVIGAGWVGTAFVAGWLSENKNSQIRLGWLNAGELFAPVPECQSSKLRRVAAINRHHWRYFSELGVSGLASFSTPIQNMQVIESFGAAPLHFDATTPMAYVCEQDNLIAALQKQIQPSNVRCWSQQTLSSMQRTAQGWLLGLASGEQIHTRLVIAADGASSQVRYWTGVNQRALPFQSNRAIAQDSAWITEVIAEHQHNNCAHQVFLESGVIGLLPLSENNGQRYSVVWSFSNDQKNNQQNDQQDEATLLKLLTTHFYPTTGTLNFATSGIKLPIPQHSIDTYAKNQVIFIGDAAHAVHPLAGQGVNIGLSDVRSLLNHLKPIQSPDDLLNPVWMRRFSRERQAKNSVLMTSISLLGSLHRHNSWPSMWLRNRGKQVLEKNILMKKWLVQSLAEGNI